MSVVKTETHSKEVDKLRSDLTDLEQQLADAKEGSSRAEEAEAELQQLTNKTEKTVPLNVHDQVVRI
jgi:DNA-binding transcriptional regulator GbsR (MarR family)